MKHIPMRLILLFVASLTASSAYADDCGESDRVTLPTCATSGRIQGTKPGMWVQNSCSHPITVKFAKSGGDTRRDIATGVRIEEEMKDGSALCCPRYNSCEDIALGLPPNLARGKTATQSSLQNDAVPGRAVDGISDGNYNNRSVTHTLSTAQAWWQVDLGSVQDIRQVVLFNRTDCCAERLSNFEIKVSSDGATWTKVAELAGAAPQRSAYPMNAPGATYACSCAAPTT